MVGSVPFNDDTSFKDGFPIGQSSILFSKVEDAALPHKAHSIGEPDLFSSSRVFRRPSLQSSRTASRTMHTVIDPPIVFDAMLCSCYSAGKKDLVKII